MVYETSVAPRDWPTCFSMQNCWPDAREVRVRGPACAVASQGIYSWCSTDIWEGLPLRSPQTLASTCHQCCAPPSPRPPSACRSWEQQFKCISLACCCCLCVRGGSSLKGDDSKEDQSTVSRMGRIFAMVCGLPPSSSPSRHAAAARRRPGAFGMCFRQGPTLWCGCRHWCAPLPVQLGSGNEPGKGSCGFPKDAPGVHGWGAIQLPCTPPCILLRHELQPPGYCSAVVVEPSNGGVPQGCCLQTPPLHGTHHPAADVWPRGHGPLGRGGLLCAGHDAAAHAAHSGAGG